MTEGKRNGATALEILQIAFIVLKLCKVIEWSWLWVLSPTWITAGIVVLVIIVIWIVARS